VRPSLTSKVVVGTLSRSRVGRGTRLKSQRIKAGRRDHRGWAPSRRGKILGPSGDNHSSSLVAPGRTAVPGFSEESAPARATEPALRLTPFGRLQRASGRQEVRRPGSVSIRVPALVLERAITPARPATRNSRSGENRKNHPNPHHPLTRTVKPGGAGSAERAPRARGHQPSGRAGRAGHPA